LLVSEKRQGLHSIRRNRDLGSDHLDSFDPGGAKAKKNCVWRLLLLFLQQPCHKQIKKCSTPFCISTKSGVLAILRICEHEKIKRLKVQKLKISKDQRL